MMRLGYLICCLGHLPMPRRPTYLKKSSVEKLFKKCRYCKTHQSSRGFDKHAAWCKKTSIIRKELQELQTHPTGSTATSPLQARAEPASVLSPVRADFDLPNVDFVEGSSSIPEVFQNQPTGMTSSCESGDNGGLSQIEIYICILIEIILQNLYSGLTCLENILRSFPTPTLQIQIPRSLHYTDSTLTSI